MSSHDYAMQVDSIAKVYRLGVKENIHDTIGASLANLIRSPISNYKKYRSLYKFSDLDLNASDEGAAHPDIFWALREVSFNIQKGEVVGIIGTNGAGKSTLLKILSRITAPTKGKITIQGRVSSLLEVGTGFHQELSGRENVYLNGTILGMQKKEIDRKFDEIVAFSGVERFLDTPVKRYSSGMRVRLAFSVAAHLEPEILIIDEVLAVGDIEFQKKCLSKMEDVGREGRTVLFVSHSMPAITRMCERVILLDGGRKVLDGSPHDVVGSYLRGGRESTGQKQWADISSAPGGDMVRLLSAKATDDSGKIIEVHDIRRPVHIEMEYELMDSGCVLFPTISLFNQEGDLMCVLLDQDLSWRAKKRSSGKYTSKVTVPSNFLWEGQVNINMVMWTLTPFKKKEFYEKDVLSFQVIDRMDGDSARGEWKGDLPGVTRPALEWATEQK